MGRTCHVGIDVVAGGEGVVWFGLLGQRPRWSEPARARSRQQDMGLVKYCTDVGVCAAMPPLPEMGDREGAGTVVDETG